MKKIVVIFVAILYKCINNQYNSKMKCNFLHVGLVWATTIVLLSSCAAESDNGMAAGKVCFSVDALTGFHQTRAVNLDEYNTTANYNVQILSDNKVVYEGTVGAVAAQSVELEGGVYMLRAYYGNDAVASQNTFLMEGSQTFEVTAGQETQVEVLCLPQCARVSASFGALMDASFSDYYVTYTTQALTAAGQSAVWAKDCADPWYLKVADDEEVVATIHVVRASDGKWAEVERKHKLSKGKSWTLSIDAQAPESNDGEVALTIVVDESTNDQNVSVVIPNEWWM